MLFGFIELQNDVLQQAKEYADLHDMTLVYGAMVGSISKGLQYADSDYDTRFLFLRKDFPEKICIPSEMKETELVKRYYPEGKVYEWIPFWELTSFLQFLDKPSFLNDFSVGLYNIVGWTFMSPYIWDPYGLQSRLMPLINQIFIKEYEIIYHRSIIEKHIEELHNEEIVAKNYLYAIHAAATIHWSFEYGIQPPVDMQTLLCGVGEKKIWERAFNILYESRNLARYKAKTNLALHASHFEIMTLYNKEITEYIERYFSKALTINCDLERKYGRNTKEILNFMYEIIQNSIESKEELLYENRKNQM